jgi:hypothetical protein
MRLSAATSNLAVGLVCSLVWCMGVAATTQLTLDAVKVSWNNGLTKAHDTIKYGPG